MTTYNTGDNYDKIASWWNTQNYNSSYGMKIINRAIRYCDSHESALDVGCGSGGRVINALIDKNFKKIIGIDVSQKMIDIAKTNHKDVIFKKSDILDWDTDETFDIILAIDSIWHLNAVDQEKAIVRITKLLNAKGIFVFTLADINEDGEGLSFLDSNGAQRGDLDNDYFSYGGYGLSNYLKSIEKNKCQCIYLEFDQFPGGHAFMIVQKL